MQCLPHCPAYCNTEGRQLRCPKAFSEKQMQEQEGQAQKWGRWGLRKVGCTAQVEAVTGEVTEASR